MKNLLLLSTLLVLGATAQAKVTDPAIKEGTLPNGLTYYISRNAEPAGQADFFLARNIGSRVEQADEKGLAHFLEHMCFNGSRNFPDNSLIQWLETVGVKFGKNLNAYTSADETVYNISAVPVGRESVVDSCLMVLRDWSDGLTLADDAIDAERGVIKGEWRHRDNASSRMLRRAAPRLYPGSPYGEAMPIGLMEVVENFPPSKLREFYHTWYRPDASAVIVTGDIDPAAMEAKIRETFGDMTIPDGSRLPELPPFPANESVSVVMESDPEQGANMFQVYFKHEDPQGADADADLKRSLLADLVGEMMVERYDDVELKYNTPVSRIGVGDTNFLLSRKVKAMVVRGQSKPGRAGESLAEMYREVLRARRLGFSQEEFARAASALLDRERAKARKGANRSNTDLAKEISRYFIDGGILETPAQRLERVERILPTLSAGDCQAWLQEVVSEDGRNMVVLGYNRPSQDGAIPSEQEMADVVAQVRAESLTPFVAQAVKGEILEAEPVRGSILSEEPGIFGTTLLTLSNGVKVMMKPTDFKEGQVFVRGVGEGGLSFDYSEALAPSLKIFNEGMSLSGAGSHSNGGLRRLLAGRDIKASVMADRNDETVELATTRDDLEDGMRLLWLKATSTVPDREAFRAWYDSRMDQLRSGAGGAVEKMGELIHKSVYSDHPLGHKLTAVMLSKADYDSIIAVYADRFADFSDFTFYVTGDFDPDAMRDLAERYLASLPAAGRIERPRDIGYRFTPGSQSISFTEEMINPMGIVYQFRHLDCPYTLRNILLASMAGQVLKARLLADLREDKGWTYSVTTHGSVVSGMNGEDAPVFMMPIYVKTDPGKIAETAEAIKSTVADMASGVTAEELEKVREFMQKSYRENIRDNAYWLAAMRAYTRTGLDLDTDYLATLTSLTPSDLSAFMRAYALPATLTELTMAPAK